MILSKLNRKTARARKHTEGIPDPVLSEICHNLKAKLQCDAAFVTFLTTKRAYVVGAGGLPVEYLSATGVELENSFCFNLLRAGSDGLVATNTREVAFLNHCPTVGIFGAWVGAPIKFEGMLIGAIGAVDHEPKLWARNSLAITKKAAAEVEITLLCNKTN